MWHAPKFLVRPTWGSNYVEMRKELELGATPNFQGRARSSGIRLGRETIILLHGPASKTNHKLVCSHLGTPLVSGQATGNLDSLDSPRLGLGRSHHLPPYIILCSSPRNDWWGCCLPPRKGFTLRLTASARWALCCLDAYQSSSRFSSPNATIFIFFLSAFWW
jgi:hypothetical protein